MQNKRSAFSEGFMDGLGAIGALFAPRPLPENETYHVKTEDVWRKVGGYLGDAMGYVWDDEKGWIAPDGSQGPDMDVQSPDKDVKNGRTA